MSMPPVTKASSCRPGGWPIAARSWVRDRRQVHRAGVAFEQNDELVAAEARHQIVLAHGPAQARRHHLEQLVASAVAERVVAWMVWLVELMK